jgi:PII-like signaling protein
VGRRSARRLNQRDEIRNGFTYADFPGCRPAPYFFGEDDKFHNQPLHEAIVLKARELHLGGATVLRGHVGFGHSSHIHTTKILRLSQDLPVIVEIVDSKEKIDAFLPVLDEMMSSGLVTIEKVQVLQYGEAKPT